MTSPLANLDLARWASFGKSWSIRPDTTYLNHGSFGPPPEPVRKARLKWVSDLDSQPMDFFVRQLEPAWRTARDQLAQFIGAQADSLVFVENATAGMNIVADSFQLHPGDEVLLTDHEYGAVVRIWERACERAQARVTTARLPLPFTTADETVDTLFSQVTHATRLIVVSHITSPTAVILPVAQICRQARERGIAICIDGPHAPAQIPLDISSLGCDFYAASCHKWLSAPFGSGFLYVAKSYQPYIRPPLLSWGRLPPQPIESWSDEFFWRGTRDSSPYLAIPDAIQFMQEVGLEFFQSGSHALAQYARHRLVELTQLEPIIPDSPTWYGSIAHVPLPPGDRAKLQEALWQQHHIEVPIVDWNGRRFIRVSCHLYNTPAQIDRLVDALRTLLSSGL
ncbi:MAG: aminotransferase class V-fold PLP-dependent enzyme [Pirellulaceae bacterium]